MSSRRSRPWWRWVLNITVSAVLVGIGVLFLLSMMKSFGPSYPEDSEWYENTLDWVMDGLMFALILTCIVVGIGMVWWPPDYLFDLDDNEPDKAVRSVQAGRTQRVDRLVHLLTEANETIAELQIDIRSGQELAEQVEARVKEQQALADMTAEQAEAVKAVVGDQVGVAIASHERQTRKRSFWEQVAINAFFLLVGLLLGWITR